MMMQQKKNLYTPCILLSWGTDALIHARKHTSPSCNQWLSCTCHYLSISSWLLCRVHPKIMNNSFVCTVSFSHSGDFSVLMNENATFQSHSKGWQKKKTIQENYLRVVRLHKKRHFFLPAHHHWPCPLCRYSVLHRAGVYFTCVN